MSKNFELLQQHHEQKLFLNPGTPLSSMVTLIGEPKANHSEESAKKAANKVTSPLEWLHRIQEKGKIERQQVSTQFSQAGNVRGLIAHEEKIKLVERVFRPAVGSAPQAVLFCGVESDEGSTSICAHISEIMSAQLDESVCVVDANFRSHALHEHFGIENSRGLAEALLGSAPITDFLQPHPQHKLWVMPSGSGFADPGLSLNYEKLKERMAELRSAFQRIVVNASPMGRDANSLLLSRLTDGVVLVVEANSTRRTAALRVKENLEIAKVKLLAVVLNNHTDPTRNSLYRRL